MADGFEKQVSHDAIAGSVQILSGDFTACGKEMFWIITSCLN